MGITLARRRCSGCRRTTGFAFWPWSGRLFVVTHGLCRGCLDATRASVGGSAASPALRSDLLY
ncbi:MAG: hypothetical protein ACQGVK_07880 [Myxococcota bacterium]